MSALYNDDNYNFLKNFRRVKDGDNRVDNIKSYVNTNEKNYPFNRDRQEPIEGVSSIKNSWEDTVKNNKKRKDPFRKINIPEKRSKRSNSDDVLSQMDFEFPHKSNRNSDMQLSCPRIIYTQEQVKESIKEFKAVKWVDYWKNLEDHINEYDDFIPIEERCVIC